MNTERYTTLKQMLEGVEQRAGRCLHKQRQFVREARKDAVIVTQSRDALHGSVDEVLWGSALNCKSAPATKCRDDQ